MIVLLACTPDPGTANPAGADVVVEDGVVTDPVYDPDAIPSFHLTIDSDDWEADLRALVPSDLCTERDTLPATLVYTNPGTGVDEEPVTVDVRLRGQSSLDSAERVGLKLDFAGHSFHGHAKVNLEGIEGGDRSLLRERLAYHVLAELGAPEPGINHAKVWVNGVYQGLFPNSEEPDDSAFVDQHFGVPGNLYKVEGYCGIGTDFTSEDWMDAEDFAESYVPHGGTTVEDITTDLVPALQCLSSADVAACAESWLDVDAWLAVMAAEVVLPDVDGLAGVGQNVMLWFPTGAPGVVYRWDQDLAFAPEHIEEDGIWSMHPSWADVPTGIAALRDAFPGRYCAALVAGADAAEGMVEDGYLDRVAAQIRPSMGEDPDIDPDGWEDAVSELGRVVADRAPEVRQAGEACVR